MWIPFKELDFNNNKILQYHIDTRDFHCNTLTEEFDFKIDIGKTIKFPANYFHTGDEVKKLLERYYEESGGDGEWRMLTLTGQAEYRTSGWQLKYIRIFRLPEGLVVYDRQTNFLFPKDMLACKVNKKYLNHH
jgi:flavorubredoxin